MPTGFHLLYTVKSTETVDIEEVREMYRTRGRFHFNFQSFRKLFKLKPKLKLGHVTLSHNIEIKRLKVGGVNYFNIKVRNQRMKNSHLKKN